MKIWKYILSAAALLTLGACNHDADEMVIPTRGLDIANHSAVIVNDLTAAEEFTLVWSAAKFGIETEVEYTVAAALAEGEAVSLGTTSTLFYTTTNGALLETLGISMGGEYSVMFTVTAKALASEETSEDTLAVRITLDKEQVATRVGILQGLAHALSRVLTASSVALFTSFQMLMVLTRLSSLLSRTGTVLTMV